MAATLDEPQSASRLRQPMAFGDALVASDRETAAGPVVVRIHDAS